MITTEMIRDAPPGTVFVFGDNLERYGLGGQAFVARPFVKSGKAFGIPTKRKPTREDDAYFNDRPDEILAVHDAIREIDEMARQGRKIVLFPGIGTGRASLPTCSPRAYILIQQLYKRYPTG